MTSSIVVLGATGYAGGLAVDSLLARGVRPVVAGSREATIAPLAERLGGLEYRVADASDLDSVKALVGAGDVLVTTVGPFNRLGRTVARAAAEQGAHYVDSTGEVSFVKHLVEDVDPVARRTGSTMLPTFGYDYVPGLLAGGLALREAPGARSIEIGYYVHGTLDNGRGLSQGTRRTVIEEMGQPALVWSGGRLTTRRMASRVAHFDVDGRSRASILAGGTEVLFLPRHHPRLAEVSVFNGWFPELARPMQAMSALVSLLDRTPVGAPLTRLASDRLTGPAGGPDEAMRSRSQTVAIAVARDAGGREVARVQVDGTNTYTLTGDLMAWAAESLAGGAARATGVVDAFEAFGFDETVAGCASLGLTGGAPFSM